MKHACFGENILGNMMQHGDADKTQAMRDLHVETTIKDHTRNSLEILCHFTGGPRWTAKTMTRYEAPKPLAGC